MAALPWLTKDFLLENFKKWDPRSDVVIQSFDVKDALKKGENFGSEMIRITVNYSIKEKLFQTKFILKLTLTTGKTAEIIKEKDLFGKEIDIYTNILPQVDSLMKSIGEHEHRLAPRCFSTSEEPAYLLFEDLDRIDFKNVDKSLGLNMAHSKLVMSNIAKWHATTAFLYVLNPDLFQRHTTPVMNETEYGLKLLIKNTIVALANVTKNWDGFEHIAKKLTEMEPRAFKSACQSYRNNEIDFTVLTHGDLWMNNVMFKYDEKNEPIRCLMLDFAAGSLTTPGKDLAYFLFSSIQKGIRESEWNQLIQQYHNILQNTLIKLNYPKEIPSFENIYTSFVKCGIHSTMAGLFVSSYSRIDKVSKTEGFDVFISENKEVCEFREEMFNNLKCRDNLMFLLDFCDRKGFFDI